MTTKSPEVTEEAEQFIRGYTSAFIDDMDPEEIQEKALDDVEYVVQFEPWLFSLSTLRKVEEVAYAPEPNRDDIANLLSFSASVVYYM